jgi:hypothetical protein
MRAQRYLLTYSQVPDTFDRDGLGPFLRSIFEKATCITVAVEEPETLSKLSSDDKWSTILEATTKEDFFKAAVDTAPRDSVLHFSSLLTFADWRYRDTPGEFITPEYECRCDAYPILTEWVD